MFLIRTIFWVSLVVLMLPVGGNNSSNLFGATKYAFNDMDNFCKRNIDICNISSEAWQTLKYKAAYSFDVVATVAKDIRQSGQNEYSPVYTPQKTRWETASIKNNKHAKDQLESQKTTGFSSQNTLTSNDLEPSWTLKPSKL